MMTATLSRRLLASSSVNPAVGMGSWMTILDNPGRNTIRFSLLSGKILQLSRKVMGTMGTCISMANRNAPFLKGPSSGEQAGMVASGKMARLIPFRKSFRARL